MPSGIDLLLIDHRTVEDLFVRLDESGAVRHAAMVMDALTMHDEAEQAALYPLVASVLGPDAVDEPLLAHSKVKMLMEQARSLEGAPLLDALALLRAAVREHVEDEERRLLPALARAASPAQLDELGARILQVKQRVG